MMTVEPAKLVREVGDDAEVESRVQEGTNGSGLVGGALRRVGGLEETGALQMLTSRDKVQASRGTKVDKHLMCTWGGDQRDAGDFKISVVEDSIGAVDLGKKSEDRCLGKLFDLGCQENGSGASYQLAGNCN